MPSAFPEAEIQRLVRLYRQTVEKLARDFVAVADWEKPQIYSLVRQNLQMLEKLDAQTKRWARRTIPGLYKATQKETEKLLSSLGLKRTDVARARSFTVVNHQAVQALLSDPTAGILPTFGRAIEEVKARMRTIQNQAKILRNRQRLIDESIAQVGFLEGRGLEDVRAGISKAILSGGKDAVVWRKRVNQYPVGHPLRAAMDVAHVTFTTSTGAIRHIRLDVYADLLARTKTAQAMGLAQRNKLLENGRALVQVSNNLPLQDDACAVYMGKVYALTKQAAKEYGVPHVDRLPSGGCPFHPNCTHDETPFFPEYEPEDEKRRAFLPTPSWALDKPWPVVQKEYLKRGGIKYAAQKVNPQLFRSQYSGGKRRHGTPAPDLGKPWDPKDKGGPPGPGPKPPSIEPPPKPVPRPIAPPPPGGGGVPVPIPGAVEIPGGAKPTVQVPPTAPVEVVVKPPGDPKWLQETREALKTGIKTEADAVAVGRPILDHIKKITARLEKVVEGLAQKTTKSMLAGDMEGFQAGLEAQCAAKDKLKTAFRRALKKTLRRIRNLGGSFAYKGVQLRAENPEYVLDPRGGRVKVWDTVRVPSSGTRPLVDAVSELQSQLPSSWIEQSNRATKPLTIQEDMNVNIRGGYDPEERKIKLSGLNSPAEIKGTICHEFGHHLEEVNPDLKARLLEFYDRRTAGSVAKNVAPWEAREVFKAGGWKEPYIGKYYEGKATEVLSMSLEAIYSEDPAAFVHLSDDDLMRFVLGLLAGVP